MRLRSHDSEGAYASENKRAVSINEVTVALPKSRLSRPMNEKVVTINSNANNHEPREIESNFINWPRLGFGLELLVFALWLLVFGPRNLSLHQKQRPKT